tara:strand:- start:737 stop:853 length:117 start_codon:yes stop_codon:yes gene_type:complete
MYLFAVLLATGILMMALYFKSHEDDSNGIWDHDFDDLP